MRRSVSLFATAAALASILATGAHASQILASSETDPPAAVRKLKVIGLTDDGRLVRFNSRNPAGAREIGPVSGLMGLDTALVGIDYRVQDGLLYGVGNAGGVYTLDTNTAVATLVSQVTVPLDGVQFGVDFNPAADRLRITSDTGQNLRHNVNAGGTTTVDLSLNYTAGVTAPGLSGSAYTNNDLNTGTGTTLFGVDPSVGMDQVVVQSPPNNGSLVSTGKLTVDPTAGIGFDIYTTLGKSGEADINDGFAVLTVNGFPGFYFVSLLTGEANLIDLFDMPVSDIAIPLNQ